MKNMISRFPEQLREAVEIGRNSDLKPLDQAVNQIFVVGLGGSGIGGNFVAEIIRDMCSVPYLVGKSYDIPKYIDKNTLAIISSYSGNTEETLHAMGLIEKTGARIICIASGGKLIERAQDKNYDFIQVPTGWDSPRACLGYSIVQQLFILNKLGFISEKFEEEITDAIQLIQHDIQNVHDDAKKIAAIIHEKTTVIYAVDRLEPVAIRLRQQLNENAKTLCWHHVVPEMNHNELVGWKDERPDLAFVILRNHDDLERNQKRIDIIKNIISELSFSWIEIFSQGNSRIEHMFYLVHVCDWISWYLADLRNVDATEIKVIDYLKSELAKLPL